MTPRPTPSPALLAVVFDVDGTLADSERHGHRVAFNLAFEEFDLPYRWDEKLYGRLLDVTGGQGRIDGFLADEGVDAAERERLAPRLHARKTELFQGLIADGRVPARPGTARLLDELRAEGITVAVATTGSRAWVELLLDRHFGLDRFAAIVTGDEVSDRKPHPEAYLRVLHELGVDADAAVAVEDSENGVQAAQAAGLAVLAVTNDYTAAQDLAGAGAAVVVDGFGMPGEPAAARLDPAGLVRDGLVDVGTLRGIVARPR